MKKIKLIIDGSEMEITGNIKSITFGKDTKYEIEEIDGIKESKSMRELRASLVRDVLSNEPKSLEELMGLSKIGHNGHIIRDEEPENETALAKLLGVDDDEIHKKLAMRSN